MTTCDLACSSRVLFAIRAVSIIVGVANITMVLRLGLRHLHHFNNKFCQSKILGKKKIRNILISQVVINLVPVYSLFSMLVVIFVASEDTSEILTTIRSTYEAILIVGFFQLIIAYLSLKEDVRYLPELN
jgi:uncharacterized membrane protein YcaP (DUF421 family)